MDMKTSKQENRLMAATLFVFFVSGASSVLLGNLIDKASPKQTIFMVCKSIPDALKLVAGGVKIDELNVGNVHRAPGKEEISKFIALGEEDKAALRELRDKYGVKFNTKATATGDDGVAPVDLNKYI